jgi:hypothetical protein
MAACGLTRDEVIHLHQTGIIVCVNGKCQNKQKKDPEVNFYLPLYTHLLLLDYQSIHQMIEKQTTISTNIA